MNNPNAALIEPLLPLLMPLLRIRALARGKIGLDPAEYPESFMDAFQRDPVGAITKLTEEIHGLVARL